MALRGFGTAISTPTSSPSVSYPASVASGDTLRAFFTADGTGTTMTAPSGWTMLTGTHVQVSADGQRGWTFERQAGGSEPSAQSFTSSGSVVGVMGAWTNRDSTTPTHQSSTSTSNTSGLSPATGAYGSATTVECDEVLFFFGDDGDVALTWTAPTGFTKQVQIQGAGNNFYQMCVCTRDAQAAGATGSYTASRTGFGGGNGSFALALGVGDTAEITQDRYQWFNNDGDEDGATPAETENVAVVAPSSAPLHLRVLLDAAGNPNAYGFQCEVKRDTDSAYRAVTTSSTVPRTLDVAVTAGSDDAQQAGTTVTLTGTTIGGSLDATTEWVGMRFDGVTIPPGATITAAALQVVPSGTGEDEPLVTIYLEDADDAATFTTGASNISTRSRTSGVAWSSTNLGATGSSYHDSPDLTTIVQAVVDRGGWASGNALAVIVQGGATTTRDLTIESFENTGSNPPTLHLEWTEPALATLAASANIPAGGTTATTARLTPPSGKTTSDFDAGAISDDTNPLPSLDLTTDHYTELVWCVQPNASALADGDVLQFRVTAGGSALAVYGATPEWEIGTPGGGGGFQAAWARGCNVIVGAGRVG